MRGDNYRRAKQYLGVIANGVKRLEAARDELNKLVRGGKGKFFVV